jgi:histidine triad (HIT) family protein
MAGRAGKSIDGGKTAGPCVFCAILAGSETGYMVFRDDVAAAFLDYRPLAIGHLLLVPVIHYAVLDDVPDNVMAALAVRAKHLSRAVVQVMDSDGSFVALNNVVSQAIPHVHIHIVPRRERDGLFASGFIWKRVAYKSDAERADVAARIRAAMQT